jgi:hypothetical protein
MACCHPGDCRGLRDGVLTNGGVSLPALCTAAAVAATPPPSCGGAVITMFATMCAGGAERGVCAAVRVTTRVITGVATGVVATGVVAASVVAIGVATISRSGSGATVS